MLKYSKNAGIVTILIWFLKKPQTLIQFYKPTKRQEISLLAQDHTRAQQ